MSGFVFFFLFFFNDTPTPEIYTLSLHDALPISLRAAPKNLRGFSIVRASIPPDRIFPLPRCSLLYARDMRVIESQRRSEEHTSELQSHSDLVCRLLLEKKKKNKKKKNKNKYIKV